MEFEMTHGMDIEAAQQAIEDLGKKIAAAAEQAINDVAAERAGEPEAQVYDELVARLEREGLSNIDEGMLRAIAAKISAAGAASPKF